MNRIEVTKYLETLYPRDLAYEWDNVGLQIGTLNKPLKRLMVTLDVTKEVVREAIERKVDLLISHHPLIFQPLSSIAFETPRGNMIQKLIKHDIALYSMHTNYDLADDGMNDNLAKLLEIRNPKLLDQEAGIGRYGDIDPKPLPEFIEYVKAKLKLDSLRVVGDGNRLVKVVGISGGSGQQHMYQAKKRGCDVFLTGDISYHSALDAREMGFTLIDISHHAEVWFKIFISELLRERFPDIEIFVSDVDTNPYQNY